MLRRKKDVGPKLTTPTMLTLRCSFRDKDDKKINEINGMSTKHACRLFAFGRKSDGCQELSLDCIDIEISIKLKPPNAVQSISLQANAER